MHKTHIKSALIALLTILAATQLRAAELYDPTQYGLHTSAGLSLTGGYCLGKLGDMYEFITGGIAEISYTPESGRNNRFFIRTGYIMLLPRDTNSEGFATGISDTFIIPILAGYEYRLGLTPLVRIAPVITAGMSLNMAVYDDRSKTTSGGVPTGLAAEKDHERMAAEPFATAGLGVYYLLSNGDSFFVRSEACSIIEWPDFFYMVTGSIGYEKRL